MDERQKRQRERERMSDQSSFGGGEYIVVSEHEGPEGRYYRMSGEMQKEYAEDRLRWIIETDGALSATMAQVVKARQRRFESVEIDRTQRGSQGVLAGNFAKLKAGVRSASKSKAKASR